MRLIARENSQAPGQPNGTYFAKSEDAPSISHQGYVGFRAGLRGRRIFVVQIPKPCTAGLLLIGSLLVFRRTRRTD